MEANLSITRVYQWLSEAIAFYFLLLPFFFLANSGYPFLNYFLLMIGSIILLPIVGLLTNKYQFIFIGSICVITACAYYLFHFPIFISILTSFFFSWRYISHQEMADQQNQLKIFGLTIVAAIMILMFSNNLEVLFIVILQFLVVVGGGFLSNIFIKSEQRISKGRLTLLLLGVPIMILGIFWVMFDLFRWLYVKVVDAVLFLTEKILTILDKWIDIKLPTPDAEKSELQEMKPMQDNQNKLDQLAQQNGEVITQLIYWTINGLIILGIVLVSFGLYKRYVNKEKQRNQEEYASISNIDSPKTTSRFRKNSLGKKPEHPIRREIFELEKYSRKLGLERKRGESLNDWFTRLELPMEHTCLYKQVRYGNHIDQLANVQEFKESIRKIRKQMEEK
ncbi:MFS transporter [Aquibacillus kalidii]|uniref:hypothetical protein n=1 Tax=Aquibacillus kalidii TaxID=2762597 RepID=UPI001648091F|nr:hypothetical protein [Aquibacillus kalidii]